MLKVVCTDCNKDMFYEEDSYSLACPECGVISESGQYKFIEMDNAEIMESDKLTQHKEICQQLIDIYEKKNHDYGDSFGKGYKEYGNVMCAIRLEDKLNRFKMLSKAESKVKDESIEDTLLDMANYAIMSLIEIRRGKK